MFKKKKTPTFVVHYEVNFGPQRDPHEKKEESFGFYDSDFEFEFDDYKMAAYFADQLIKNDRAVLEFNRDISVLATKTNCWSVRSFEHAIPPGWIIISRDIWIDTNASESE